MSVQGMPKALPAIGPDHPPKPGGLGLELAIFGSTAGLGGCVHPPTCWDCYQAGPQKPPPARGCAVEVRGIREPWPQHRVGMLVGSWQTEGRGVERALAPGVWRSERNAGPQSPRRDSHLSRSISEGRGADQELAQRSTWDCDPQAGAALASRSSGALTRLVCFCSSTSKSKELSPGSGQKGSAGSSQGTPGAGTQPGAQAGASPSQPPPDQSPHTLRKGTAPRPFTRVSGWGQLSRCPDTRAPRLAWMLRDRVTS